MINYISDTDLNRLNIFLASLNPLDKFAKF